MNEGKKRRIQLSDHFGYSTILMFALPSIGMQLVDNTYQIADGYFISNYIGERAFEAENLIFPPLLIVMYVGLMFGTGASALIARELGEGKKERVNQLLSMVTAVLAATGVLLSAALYFLLPATISNFPKTPLWLSSSLSGIRLQTSFSVISRMVFLPPSIPGRGPDSGFRSMALFAVVIRFRPAPLSCFAHSPRPAQGFLFHQKSPGPAFPPDEDEDTAGAFFLCIFIVNNISFCPWTSLQTSGHVLEAWQDAQNSISFTLYCMWISRPLPAQIRQPNQEIHT